MMSNGGLNIISRITLVYYCKRRNLIGYFSTYYPGPVKDAAKKSDLVIVCLGTGIINQSHRI